MQGETDMLRVCVPVGKSFVFRLSFLSSALGITAFHLCDDFLIGVRSWSGFLGCRNARQQTPLNHRENFAAFDRLTKLIFAPLGDLLFEAGYILKRFAFA